MIGRSDSVNNQLSPEETILIATVIALVLAKDKTADELNLLGNLVVAIGSLLLVYAAQQQSIQNEPEVMVNATE